MAKLNIAELRRSFKDLNVQIESLDSLIICFKLRLGISENALREIKKIYDLCHTDEVQEVIN